MVRLTAGAPLLAALLLSCVRSGPPAPAAPAGPDSLAQRATGTFRCYNLGRVVLRISYVVDWGDFAVDTGPELRLGDTATFTHAWADTGSFAVRCLALDAEGRRSEWSDARAVLVVNRAPGTPGTPAGPDSLPVDSLGEFAAAARDPEADLLRYVFDWGDGRADTTAWHASGDTARLLHAWDGPGDYAVRALALDPAGHRGGWSAPKALVVKP